ncbi:MAG: GDP-mannose 4,6-dehydratase, partial [Gemmatimonadota bacterium]|nr:GDP-mannose 4,6-dehydratase [Gemmatimonadota bacterium]
SGLPVVMFGDGSSERDYTHVTDISTGIIRAIQWVSNGAPTCEVFNLGNGRATALRGVIDLVATALGSEPLIEEAPLAIGDLSRTCADIGKAARVLGYDPKISIEEGIPDFVNWYEATHGRTTKANG